MEKLLQIISEAYPHATDAKSLMKEVGHANPDLRCWGVLDSVLRMMPKPEEILVQPQRFLSYFISPEPPIENLQKFDDSVSFDLPVSSDQYPLTTAYLCAAFESLPVYVKEPLAKATWNGIHISVTWKPLALSVDAAADPGHLISPNLMQSIVESMQKQQRELEEKNRVLLLKNDQLEQITKNLEHHVQGTPISKPEWVELLNPSTQLLKQQFQRLQDYLIRAQQLITILVGQDRMSPEVREAMRRVDWEYVKEQFPVCVEEGMDALQKMKVVTEPSSQENIAPVVENMRSYHV